MPQTQAPPSKAEAITTKARSIAREANYFVAKVVKVFEPEHDGDEWEVLFVGRFQGAGTKDASSLGADPKEAALPYRIWVNTATGGGYVTEGW